MRTTESFRKVRRSRKRRPFTFLLIVVTWGAGGPVRQASAQAEAADWIPESATLIAHLDLGTLLSNANFRGLERVLETELSERTLERARDLTGMDPWRDVFTIGYFRQNGKDGPRLWGAAVSGAFDFERILTSLEARMDVEQSEHLETRLYVSRRARDGVESRAFAFVNGTTILIGSTESVRLMLDVSNGLEPSSADGPLAHYLDRMSAADAFWIVSMEGWVPNRQLRRKVPVDSSLPALESFSFAARLGSGLAVRMEAEATDSERAGRLADVLKGAMALAAGWNDSSSALSNVAESLELETLDERIEASFEIDSRTVRDWLRERIEPPKTRSP